MMKCKAEQSFNRRRTDSPSRIKYGNDNTAVRMFQCLLKGFNQPLAPLMAIQQSTTPPHHRDTNTLPHVHVKWRGGLH